MSEELWLQLSSPWLCEAEGTVDVEETAIVQSLIYAGICKDFMSLTSGP